MEDKILDFERPTQVAFWDVDGGHYIGGIAFVALVSLGFICAVGALCTFLWVIR